ncbi:MAG: TAT-variant-translocated molybdopterin oxidoreductase [Ignavibacteriae bacterium]|nr:TAT-variant-translocated molybdopterin oxidoreductase [Ignavibacteriota bacterium]
MSNKIGTNNIWKSIKEFENDPKILEDKLHEFKSGVTDDFDPENMSTFSRRKFLAVLAASTAYVTTACTNYRDKGEIVPYVKRPEEILPGKPTYYASTFSEDGLSYGILVKTREGRPIKIEGNPDDPINKGKIPSKVHASILNLYDPDRLQFPTKAKVKTTWKNISEDLIKILNDTNSANKEIAIFANPITSPTTQKVLNDFKIKFPTTKIYTTQLANNNNKISAWKKSYGQNIIPSIKWDKAKIIVALESDFLGKEGNTVENRIKYSDARDIVKTKELNKLYSVEGAMSLTGMNADVRFRLNPIMQFDFLLSLINELIKVGAVNSDEISSSILSSVNNFSLQKFAEKSGLSLQKLKLLVSDLKENKSNSILFAGDVLNSEVHFLVNLINELLGNQNLYDFENGFLVDSELTTSAELKNFIDNGKKGNIGAIISFDANPIYELPKSFGVQEIFNNSKTTICISEVPNETSEISKYVLPINNYLESWGDHKTRNGHLTFQQPVISPLFDTKQKEEILLTLLGNENPNYHQYLMNEINTNVYAVSNSAADFNTYWLTALHDGILKVSNISESYKKIDQSFYKESNIKTDQITILLQNNYSIGTGKYSNNGWLQELPHPVTKVTWDNFAAISPATAEKLNVTYDDVIEINLNSKKINLPAFIQPGMADDIAVIELGYGRKFSGEVANEVGVNVYEFLSVENLSNYIFSGAQISKTGETYKLASTQEHHSLNDESVKDFHKIRNIIQEGTLEEYKKNPNFLKEHKHEIFSITKSHEYKNEKWAMSIDLNKCLGCSECVSSCNVENNVPVVGKDQVSRGREMHWIRIDRYYSGTPEEPIVSNQPMLCQHCDNAPCENVCPVNATNHSPDGLNQMAYNRCVGTRYCANNCPYKVRRFNFYNFRDNFADAHYDNELTYLVNNPEVTVRSRGVIEKCSFCVQNIMLVRENAIRENRAINPNEVKTACQTACPANAIEFGDTNNKESFVNKFREHELSYHVLEELNIVPNVTYIAKIRNTHSEDV